MLSLVRTSLVLVSLLLVLHVSEALPLEEWRLSRSKIDDVNNEKSRDDQRYNEESYMSLKEVPSEDDHVPDVFADDHSESSLSDIVRRQQCRFGGCGKRKRNDLKKVPSEEDHVPDVFADDHSESSLSEIVRRQQCRFGGCGKRKRNE